MATCATKDCLNWAEPNPADTENGPHPRDLDPVWCDECIMDALADEEQRRQAFQALGFPWYHIFDIQGRL